MWCHYCGAALDRDASTRDHIVPRARRGSSSAWNIVRACAPCNVAKANRMPDAGHLEHCERCAAAVARWEAGERGRPRAPASTRRGAREPKVAAPRPMGACLAACHQLGRCAYPQRCWSTAAAGA